MSVLLGDGESYADTLLAQDERSVEVAIWMRDAAADLFAHRAEARGWRTLRVTSPLEALSRLTSDVLIHWDVYQANGNALGLLALGVDLHPEVHGSSAQCFDGAIAWRRSAFDGFGEPSRFRGVGCVACSSRSGVWPLPIGWPPSRTGRSA